MSKGSNPRPFSIPQNQFGNNWDLIFKKSKNADNQSDKKGDNDGKKEDDR
jgi:hypothetical protein